MKRLFLILFLLITFTAVKAQPFAMLANGESGLSVRTNLNNALTYLNGLGLEFEFSADGASWHYPWSSGDKYIRYSGNFGSTFSDPVFLWDGGDVSKFVADTLVIGGDTITSFGGGYLGIGDSTIYATQYDILSSSTMVYSITLPSSTTVAGRIAGAVEGTNYPTGWVLAEGSSSVDLQITHTLNKRPVNVTVFSSDVNGYRQLFGNAAFSGMISPSANVMRIESLATIQKTIVIYIIFS